MTIKPCDLAPQQKAIFAARKRYVFIYGGVGTFKTTGGLLRIWEHCNEYPKSEIIVLAPTFDQVKSIYLSEWTRQIDDSEWTYNQSDHIIQLKESQSKIRLFYSDHKEAKKRIRGSTISGYHIIQAESIRDEELFHELDQRMRLFGDEPNPAYIRILDANPGNPGHWVHQFFIDKENPRYFANPMITRIKCQTTPSTSAYSQETIDHWRRIHPGWLYSRMVEGEWTFAEGRVWEDYTTFDHPSDKMKDYAAQYDYIGLGCDPGGTDPCAIVFIGYKKGVYEIFDELYLQPAPAVNIIHEQVLERLNSWGLSANPYTIWCDPSAKWFVTEWNNIKGNKIQAYQALHKGTDVVINRALKIYNLLRTKRLIVSNLCRMIIRDLERTVYKKDTTNPEIDKKTHNPHSMDAVGYWVMREVL